MKTLSVHQQYSESYKCEVCESGISYLEYLQLKDLDYVVCNSVLCRRIMRQKSQMVPFHFEIYLLNQKKQFQILRKQADLRKEYSDKIEKNERTQNHKVLQTFLESNPQYSEANVELVRIPSGLTKLTLLANERIRKYSKYLNKIIQEALENIENKEKNTVTIDQNDNVRARLLLAEQRFSKSPNLRTIADRLCEMCKGGCCSYGKDHAYLSASTIMQLIKHKPELSIAEIKELYLSKVNSKTIEGACINQTKLGCSLPRYMRSNICNGYYCDSVKSYLEHEELADVEKQTTVFAVQWNYTNWNRLDSSFENKLVKAAMVYETEV